MYDSSKWDWKVGRRLVADLDGWRAAFEWVEETQASPDGEKLGAVVKADDMEFTVCEEKGAGGPRAWEEVFDKVYNLGYGPDGRLVGLVSDTGEWTVGVDGTLWENSFDFVWNPTFAGGGSRIVVTAQKDREYFPVIDDAPWEETFFSLNNVVVSEGGGSVAASIQSVPTKEGEIFKFQNGCFSAAKDGKAWDANFVNVWELGFSSDGARLAAEVRTSLYDYTIAVDGRPWDKSFASVWRPVFVPGGTSVTAPVKIGGEWFLAKDGETYWDNGFYQLWHHRFDPSGRKIAAIVAPELGRWTVAVDGAPWMLTFGEMLTDMVFSPDGTSVACLGKENGRWAVAVDGKAWEDSWDMAWQPVFSPDSRHVAAKVERGGKYTLVVDGVPMNRQYARLWDPVFGPDSGKVLVRGIGAGPDAGKYFREVVDLGVFSG